ncbi:MAG: hypothetical protein QHH00_01445 [Methanomassiliicoccales archaeon]|nr:hypothetical protein [Methanomassiliicoccales archaeon]
MTRVRVGEHLCVNLSRRSLCDNCWTDSCPHNREELVEFCEHFKPPFAIYRKCPNCGGIYELFSNFKSLDPDLCPRCNESGFRIVFISFAKR